MIGIFDSGAGGLAALRELRRLCPEEDILFLADRKNAPYGNKTEDEITKIAEKNITSLLSLGAERVLIACCTASTVHKRLSQKSRLHSTPIIYPAAKAAVSLTENGRVAVIATEHTARSHAFSKAVSNLNPNIRVTEFPAQPLVEIAEAAANGEKLSKSQKDEIEKILVLALSEGADTLILGCTHFSHLKNEIKSIAQNIKIADSALEGARIMARSAGIGIGETIFL